ncbi:pyruvate dehydrogenase E1 component, alpha subunit [Necator americanus]|uniref:Pyruvate dehydrogenase E1 component subunit alpha n=1 Tax=Necator americanus TaxID=51031 RepID=W2TEW4_NECAM|nr:pyruvate dehydrogenase E1 component, alpha subunit [Necator americanus]ETN80139.1 pyruvate dehydrogenase E1 component, alpha subunit [Necator americanus]
MALLVKSFKAPAPILTGAIVASQRRMASSKDGTFHTKAFKLHRLDKGPSESVTLNRDDALDYYRKMQLIRRMESAAGNLYKEKKIRGFCHLYSGQEACAVGMRAAMTEGDAVITAYRCHGWTLLQGATVAEVLSELTGRITGNVHGKGGSMHMYQKDFYGGNGIVGAQQPIGTGIAFAMKYRKQKNVCLTLYGDGAANQGQFYESANMATLWNLPVLYVCENNGFGMGTQAERSSASTDYYTRGDYVPGVWVDGMDVLAVREAVRWGKEYCNSGKGPLVLEMATYRYSGHSMSDPGTSLNEFSSSYRTREEIQEVRKTRDPITGFKDRIITSGLATEDDLKAIDKDVRKEVDEAVKVANTAELMPAEGVYTDLYHNCEPQQIRGSTIDVTHTQKFIHSADLMKSLNK